MTVADHTPSESVTTVQGRYDDESPVETFVGDTIGRIGTLFTIVVGAATVGALGNVGPVHPLSGISTLGGLAGALTGLFVVQGSFMLTRGGIDNLFSGGDTDGYASAKKSVLSADGWNWQQYGAYSGYWLTLAYGFPTIYRLRDWPYGATIDLAGTLPSAYRYVVVLFAISLAVYTLWTVRSDRDTDHLTNIGSVAFIHVIFGAGLIFSAGYACSVWYNLIGFATAAC